MYLICKMVDIVYFAKQLSVKLSLPPCEWPCPPCWNAKIPIRLTMNPSTETTNKRSWRTSGGSTIRWNRKKTTMLKQQSVTEVASSFITPASIIHTRNAYSKHFFINLCIRMSIQLFHRLLCLFKFHSQIDWYMI